jgi:uncharacterized membrane protein YhaH (DUF805 family)
MGNQYYGASDFKAIHGFFANYTNFSGYSSRREYWWWQLSSTLVMTVVGFGLSLVMFGSWDNLMRGNSGEMNMLQVTAMVFGGVLAGVFLVATLIPHVALSVRRFRDAGVYWGWNILLESVIVLSRFVPLPIADRWLNGGTLACLAIDVVICCLPSHKPKSLKTHGIKMANVQRLQNALAIVLILLTILMIIAHWYWLIPILLVANFVSTTATGAFMREARNRAGKIWSLAKQLELSAEDLQQLTQAYTVQNWQDSQPSHLVFVPDPVIAWNLIDILEKQLTTLTQDLSSLTKP